MAITAAAAVLGGAFAGQIFNTLKQNKDDKKNLNEYLNFKDKILDIKDDFDQVQITDIFNSLADSEEALSEDLSRTIGAQRAGFASQNISVGQGTAGLIEEETRRANAKDLMTLRNNAFRDSLAVEIEGSNRQLDFELEKRSMEDQVKAVKNERTSGLLSSVVSIAGGFL